MAFICPPETNLLSGDPGSGLYRSLFDTSSCTFLWFNVGIEGSFVYLLAFESVSLPVSVGRWSLGDIFL
jgi:hypothetical protein